MADASSTIYDWAGGHEAFVRWLSRFYDLVELEAPDIAAMFGGRVSEEHRAHVIDWWVEVMGGPAAYTERRGGYEHMLARHRDLAITATQRLTFVTLLSRSAAPLMTPVFRRIPSSARRSWATRNGARAWPSTIRSLAPKRSHTPRFRAGDGESRPRTSRRAASGIRSGCELE
ncbi:MAG: oxidoreductase [Solirubrobacteraceae bacterium]